MIHQAAHSGSSDLLLQSVQVAVWAYMNPIPVKLDPMLFRAIVYYPLDQQTVYEFTMACALIISISVMFISDGKSKIDSMLLKTLMFGQIEDSEQEAKPLFISYSASPGLVPLLVIQEFNEISW